MRFISPFSFSNPFIRGICIYPMPLDGTKGMLTDGLPPFIALRVLLDIVVVDVHCILLNHSK
jgi:hypothetical protein